VLSFGLVAFVTFALALGLRSPGTAPAPGDARLPTDSAGTNDLDAGGPPSPTAAADADGKRDTASSVELEAAKAGGLVALQELHARYPQDPVVLKVLVLEHGRSPDGLPKALGLLDELIAADPAKVEDDDVGRLLVKAADSASAALARQAFQIMAERAGKRGPDLLYEVWVGDGRNAAYARKLLNDPKVRELTTPALGIAVELRQAQGCKEKAKLLERAAALGDERVIAILGPLVSGKDRGCGFLGLGSCPAPCWQEASAMKKTIQVIRDSRRH
jgi:hypothetical protein